MAEAPHDVPFLDAHHHFWDMSSGVYYDWLSDKPHDTFVGHSSRLAGRNFLPDDYRALAKAADVRIAGTVHIEAECDRKDCLKETAWLHELNKATGLPTAVVAWAPVGTPDSDEILAQQKAHPLVRAIRSKPRTGAGPDRPPEGHDGTMQDPKWRAGLALLARHGLGWDLRVPWWHLEEAAGVVAEHPDLHVVANHTGLPWDRSVEGLARWRRGMEALAALPNVMVKLSELGHKDYEWSYDTNAPLFRETIAMFGVDRCLFASNFPVAGLRVDYATMMAAYRRIVAPLSREDQDKLFWKNALKAYRIDPAAVAV